MKQNELPLGFVMSLAQNPEALNKFNSLNNQQKEEIINATHTINSKNEMRHFVGRIAKEY